MALELAVSLWVAQFAGRSVLVDGEGSAWEDAPGPQRYDRELTEDGEM